MNDGFSPRRPAVWRALVFVLPFALGWPLCAAPEKKKSAPAKPPATKPAAGKPVPAREFPVPGPPAGDLPMELLQARAYCRGMEAALAKVLKDFPALATDAVMANATWRSSPFAKGADAIEADFKARAGKRATAELLAMDEKLIRTARLLSDIKTEAEATAFLDLVNKRSKGEIEVPMVRASLLWQYPPYQKNPEKEFRDGYQVPVDFTSPDGVKLHFKMPMSWRESPRAAKDGVDYVACWGHATTWFTLIVKPITGEDGTVLPAADVFDTMTRDTTEEQYSRLGITLKEFTKTKLNGAPAIMQTMEAPYEQLGKKAAHAMLAVLVFHGTHTLNLQLHAMAPVTVEGEAMRRAATYRPLFEAIAGTLTADPPDPEKMRKAADALAAVKKASEDLAAAPMEEQLKAARANAEKGDPQAQALVGLMYVEGKGVPQDDRQALVWLRKAADKDVPEAQYTVGLFYSQGRGGLKKSDKEAFIWWKRAAAAGYAEAQHDLGVCYRDATGTERDHTAAVKWFQKSADQGLAQAQLNLAIQMNAGRGTRADGAKALEWALKAAHQGLAEGQSAAGLFYISNNGVPQDPVRAHAWLTLGSAGGATGGDEVLKTISDNLTPAQKAASLKLMGELKAKIVPPPGG